VSSFNLRHRLYHYFTLSHPVLKLHVVTWEERFIVARVNPTWCWQRQWVVNSALNFVSLASWSLRRSENDFETKHYCKEMYLLPIFMRVEVRWCKSVAVVQPEYGKCRMDLPLFYLHCVNWLLPMIPSNVYQLHQFLINLLLLDCDWTSPSVGISWLYMRRNILV
jgi:hypothetical protein